MSDDETRNCNKHGRTLFKLRKSKNKSWFSCYLCLKDQWRKAQLTRRGKPEVRAYQKDFNKSYNNIRKSLSVYLTMILLAANIKPE